MSAPARAASKTLAVYARLEQVYGPRKARRTGDPLGELIATILSQNTSDINSGRAYAALRQRYPTWEEVLDAPTAELYDTIRSAGLGNIKAPRIQNTLRTILERRGELSLDFLDDLPLDQARAWLRSLEGIGPKTAACVLLFALGKPAMPVDTHVHRVAGRLGLIGPRVSAEQAHALLEGMLPPEAVYPFHVEMIQHGRQICQAQRPRCPICPLADLCDFYHS
ncbi:MAG TPA: endonuclease III [Roseiflexaceae bacterium]|nr:endonuclease III [Roseiflexaceae bacterium]